MSSSCVRRSRPEGDLPHGGILRRCAEPADTAELDAFRAGADRFIAELDEEFYLHYAGLKERLELEPIYERHADLTELEQAQRSARPSTATAASASSGASPARATSAS